MSSKSSHKTTRRRVDWESIEKEYRAGQLSNVEIGKRYGVAESTIRKRAKKHGWTKALARVVREGIQEEMVRENVREARESHAQEGGDASSLSDEEITKAAIERGATVIKTHRKDIKKSLDIVSILQDQLMEVAQIREEIEEEIHEETSEDKKARRRSTMLRAVSLPTHASMVRDLAMAQKTLVALERQAFSIDDDGRTPNEETPKMIQVVHVSAKDNPYIKQAEQEERDEEANGQS